VTGPLDAAALNRDLELTRFTDRVMCVAECESTNLLALQLASRRGWEADRTVILAEHQAAGRGRLGRSWQAPRGAGLLMTVLVHGDPPVACRLVLATGIAVCETVAEVADVTASLRWPNDVFVGSRKLAGVLVETAASEPGNALALGIGLNCLQKPGHFAPELRDLLTRLDKWLDAAFDPADASLARVWVEHSDDLGRRATLTHAGRTLSGTVVEIDDSLGAWLQLDDGGRVRFDPLTTRRIG
jgi:BirA family biotin operon repressor/biotin-[acetyl-CoA-carboxylase] ligase